MTAITLLIVWFLGGGYYAGLISLGISVVLSELQHALNKALGGISGDVIGASNELTRLSSLIVLSLVAL